MLRWRSAAALLQALQAAAVDRVQWLGQVLPGAESLMARITPLPGR